MNLHFSLLILTLIFNIIGLIYYIPYSIDLEDNRVDVEDLKIYFSFKVVFIFWDLDELAVQLSLLYIVYSLTDPKNIQESNKDKKVMAAEYSKEMMKAIEEQDLQRSKKKFEAHQLDMSRREFEAL